MTPRRDVPLDAAEIIRALARRDVDYLLIGGLAVQAHGHVRTTQDADVLPRPDQENLERLAAALNDLGARPVGAPAPERPVRARDLTATEPAAFDTNAGGIDVHSRPPGADAYAGVRARALVVTVAGVEVPFCGLDDLIAMKLASGRPIDRGDIATLTAGES